MQLAVNTGRKISSKIRHLGTIAQLCQTVSSQLRHISTIGKKNFKQQYLLHTSLQYGELRPTNGWDRFTSATASSSGHQPNFAALNRGRHLYSAGRPSRWAMATF